MDGRNRRLPGGTTTQGYLWGLFNNNTGTSRYAVRAYTEVYLDGVYSQYLNSCAFDEMLSGQSAYALLGVINYTCGQQFSLKDTWVAWDTNASQCSDPVAPDYDGVCNLYPASKCSKEIGEVEFLSPNFYYECGLFGYPGDMLCRHHNRRDASLYLPVGFRGLDHVHRAESLPYF